jgi:hypothetical protein
MSANFSNHELLLENLNLEDLDVQELEQRLELNTIGQPCQSMCHYPPDGGTGGGGHYYKQN